MLKKILISLVGGVLLTILTNHMFVSTEQITVDTGERIQVTCIQAPCEAEAVMKESTLYKRGFPLVTRESTSEADATYSWTGRFVNVAFYGGLVFLALIGVKRLQGADTRN